MEGYHYLIIYLGGMFIQILFGVIQSRMISSGVTQLENQWREKPKMHNSFLDLDTMPSEYVSYSFFWPFIWPIVLIAIFWGKVVMKLDEPTPKKNKLIEDAEKDKLDLKEFVTNKQKLK